MFFYQERDYYPRIIIKYSPKQTISFSFFRYYRFNKLKQKNPNLKTLLAVGGWTAGSTPFSTLAANPSLRKTFASTSVTYLRKYTFDGLDMDWEYPAHRGGSYLDKRNFVLLLKVCVASVHACVLKTVRNLTVGIV